MGHFSFTSFVALILLYLLVLFPIFLRECIFGFTIFSLFLLYFFISFLFSLSYLLSVFSGSFVLVQIIQVMGFYKVFIIKNKGEWGVCTRGK